MGNSISKKIDFSKNIYIKICPTYYQYKNYDDFLENEEKYIISYKKLTKNDIIKFMTKQLKNNNYILEFDNNNNYSIENIKTDKNYILISVKYKNITKNYNGAVSKFRFNKTINKYFKNFLKYSIKIINLFFIITCFYKLIYFTINIFIYKNIYQ